MPRTRVRVRLKVTLTSEFEEDVPAGKAQEHMMDLVKKAAHKLPGHVSSLKIKGISVEVSTPGAWVPLLPDEAKPEPEEDLYKDIGEGP